MNFRGPQKLPKKPTHKKPGVRRSKFYPRPTPEELLLELNQTYKKGSLYTIHLPSAISNELSGLSGPFLLTNISLYHKKRFFVFEGFFFDCLRKFYLSKFEAAYRLSPLSSPDLL